MTKEKVTVLLLPNSAFSQEDTSHGFFALGPELSACNKDVLQLMLYCRDYEEVLHRLG